MINFGVMFSSIHVGNETSFFSHLLSYLPWHSIMFVEGEVDEFILPWWNHGRNIEQRRGSTASEWVNTFRQYCTFLVYLSLMLRKGKMEGVRFSWKCNSKGCFQGKKAVQASFENTAYYTWLSYFLNSLLRFSFVMLHVFNLYIIRQNKNRQRIVIWYNPPFELQREDQSGKKVPKYRWQMLRKKLSITQDLQPPHTKAKLLLHAKRENQHLITQHKIQNKQPTKNVTAEKNINTTSKENASHQT